MNMLQRILLAIFGPMFPMSDVDVAAILQARAAQNPEKLDWRHSIVDLLKLLKLDSSLPARQELAHELGYPGDVDRDSTLMNVWLHEAVLKKIAENRGIIPD
jgi:hypothetical protein